MGEGSDPSSASGSGGPEGSLSVTTETGNRFGVSADKEGVQGFTQKRLMPFVYGAKTSIGKDGVQATPGVTVETPSYPPRVGVYGTATFSPYSSSIGAGVGASVPRVGDVSADMSLPLPQGPTATAQAGLYDYNNVPLSQRDPLILSQADQADGGHRLQNYNDDKYGPAAPGQKHVTICPTCPPWPNVPKDANGYPKPLQSWQVNDGPEGE